MIRHQLPVSSPVGVGPILRGAGTTLTRRVAALDALVDLLRGRFSAEDVRLTASGTDALRLALETLGRVGGGGREAPIVALPAYSCFDMVTAAVGARVSALFYDVDPIHLAPDPESFERALSRGASIAVVGNLYGYPLDWDEIREIAGRYDTLVIEDAAQGIGSAWRGVEGGNFGDASILSFGRGKGWTGGGGGALLCRRGLGASTDARTLSLQPARAADAVRPLLGTTAQWIMGRPWLYGIPASIPALSLGETVYKEPRAPRAMAPAVAAVVMATEARAMSVIPARRAVAGRWEDLSQQTERWAGCVPLEQGLSSYLRFPAVARSPGEAVRVAQSLGSAGVARGYPASLTTLPQVRGILREDLPTPGADLLAQCIITFPTHEAVSRTDFAWVERALG